MGRGPVKRLEGRRLVYFGRAADARFWSDHWDSRLTAATYVRAAAGDLGWYATVIPRHFPRAGRILEAGCGVGWLVLALRTRGYDAEGVEWSEEVVRRVRELRPDLAIRQGDVTRLDVPDGYYSGYISLGVVEHRREGPEPFLEEAWRVLAPGGVALFSVPCVNALRRAKARLGFYRGRVPAGAAFYQYAYRRDEMGELLSRAGFDVVEQMTYGSWETFRQEVAPLRWLAALPGIESCAAARLRSWDWVEGHLGHVLMLVCRKRGAAPVGTAAA